MDSINKNKKQLLKKFFIVLFFAILLPYSALAANNCGACPSNAIVCNPLNACSFQDIIDKLIGLVTIIAIALVPLMFVWAGFNFVTANGEPEKIKKAKDIMLYTVIGLAVVLLSRAVISVVKGVLGAS
jgi:hypothetical protein